MNAWKPTDEHLEKIADDWAEYADDERCDCHREGDAYRKAAETLIQWPGIQSIIRAAQAEALRAFATDLGSVVNPPVEHRAIFWVQSQLRAESDRVEGRS